MVTLGGKSLSEPSPRPLIPGRIVTAPAKHQGIGDALSTAFPPPGIPPEIDALLAKLR